MRILRLLLILIAAAAGLWLLPTALGGGTSYITTDGNSMEPQFHTGDLAIVHATDTYDVGDVVAYHSSSLDAVVMHRIVSVEGGRYSFKGDNNNFIDADRPTSEDFVGKLAFRIPQGGVWLQRLTSPPVLGIIAFALIAAGGTAARSSRRRQRRPKGPMSRHTASPTSLDRRLSSAWLSIMWWPLPLKAAAGIVAALAVAGTAVGVWAWNGPVERQVRNETSSAASLTFSYTAEVPPSPAYDDSIVNSPSPVFRKITNDVNVHVNYQGEPGTISIDALLSTPAGWNSTVPLSPATSFIESQYETTVALDLKALESRAAEASEAIGIPSEQLTITVLPHITTSDGATFSPPLQLSMTPLQLSLVGDKTALTVENITNTSEQTAVPRTAGWADWTITAASARIFAPALLLAALIIGAALVIFARRTKPASEGAAIRRRYANLLIPVEPFTTPLGNTIDVTDFSTLARIAERYGLLVLQWSGPDTQTFIVRDESTTYRFRAAVHPDHRGDWEPGAWNTPVPSQSAPATSLSSTR